MQPTTLQITVLMAFGLVLLLLFAITDVQLTSTTTISVSRPQTVVTRTRRVSHISQAYGSLRSQQHTLGGSIHVIDANDVDSTAEVRRVSVRVYVEALCPDSARFVVYDLASDRFPSSLWDIVDINYIFWVRSCSGIVFGA